MPRIPYRASSEIKRVVVEEMELHGGKLTTTQICALPQVALLLRTYYENPKNARSLIKSFIKNVHGRFVESDGAYIPLLPESAHRITFETCVEVSKDGTTCILTCGDAYELAWAWAQRTRTPVPAKASVRCAVHSALRCNRNGTQHAYKFVWRRIEPCATVTLQTAIAMFMNVLVL